MRSRFNRTYQRQPDSCAILKYSILSITTKLAALCLIVAAANMMLDDGVNASNNKNRQTLLRSNAPDVSSLPHVPPPRSFITYCEGDTTNSGRCTSADKVIPVTDDLQVFQLLLRRAMDARRLMTSAEHSSLVERFQDKPIRGDVFEEGKSSAYGPYSLYGHVLMTPGLVNTKNLLWFEFGVFSGASVNMTAHMQGQNGIVVHGFDTFTGLPEDWKGHLSKGAFDQGGNFPPVEPGVKLHKGLFSETLPGVLKQNKDQKIAGMNIDCDLYQGAIESLNMTYKHWTPGTILHFHELQQSTKSKELRFTDQEESVALHEFLSTHPGTVLELLPIHNRYAEPVVFFVVSSPN
jgi:hypothetical protein